MLVISCADRDRTNPLDPKGSSSSPVAIEIIPDDQNASLQWSVGSLTDFTGFRLFRAVNDSTQFTLYKSFQPDQRSYTDTDLQENNWYYYYLTVLGKGTESPPSNTVKMLPGPGNTWVLSRFGQSVHQQSYDLLTRINIYNVQFSPLNWDWNSDRNHIWFAFDRFGYISRLNLDQGYEDVLHYEGLDSPVDVQWDDAGQRLFILDRDKQKIFSLVGQTLVDSIALLGNNFFKLQFTSQSHLWAMDSSKMEVFNTDGSTWTQIQFNEGFKGWDFDYRNDKIYILISNSANKTSQIIAYNEPNGTQQTYNLDKFYTLIRKRENSQMFWAAEKLGTNDYRAVKLQLSNGEDRLLNLPAMQSIEDIQINPFDQSVVIVQRFEDKISLFDSTGTKLSEKAGIFDPIKVFIH